MEEDEGNTTEGGGEGEGEGEEEPTELFDYSDLLQCALASNVDTSGVQVDEDSDQTHAEAMEAFIRENTAQRANGELVWLGPTHDDPPQVTDEGETSEGEDPSQKPSRRQQRPTQTQQAVTQGDPRLPRHINKRILNPTGNGSPIADYDPANLPSDDYRKDLWNEIGKVPMGELRDALGERTAAMWDSQEFDGIRETPVRGDLLSA